MDLKPCPKCGSTNIYPATVAVPYTNCRACGFVGPQPDPDGKWWNSLPRKGDAPQATVDSSARERRDRFAAAALTGMLTDKPSAFRIGADEVARYSAQFADAMIARLGATEVRDGR